MAEHRHDLEADFLRFYRTDMYSLDFAKVYRLAERVFAYGGVMTALRNAEIQAHQPVREVARHPAPQPITRPKEIAPLVRVSPGARMVPLSALMAETGSGQVVRVKKKTAA